MSVVASSRLLRRVPVRALMAWCGFGLSPALLFFWLSTGAPADWPFGPRLLMPIVAMLLPAGVLPRRPFLALALMVLNVALVELSAAALVPDDPAFHDDLRTVQVLAVDAVVGYLAATRRRLVSLVTAAGVLIVQLFVAVAVQLSPADLNNRVTQIMLAVLAAWAIGNSVRQRRLSAHAQRAQAAASAVQAERLRIARELHDMIAHCLGAVAIQAGMARRVLDTQPEEARKALAAIEDSGRETLAALRRMLGSLRRADPESGSAPLGPAPGMADLGSLIDRSRELGVQVEIRSRGGEHPLPAELDLSAYRIIQEAITNVVRHSDAHRCEIVVNRCPDELSIEVLDDGRGGAADTGYGLAGMRERVSLLGGEFAAGPRPEGGFRVAARIPINPAAR